MNPPLNKNIEDCEVNCLKDGMDFVSFADERLKEYY